MRRFIRTLYGIMSFPLGFSCVNLSAIDAVVNGLNDLNGRIP